MTTGDDLQLCDILLRHARQLINDCGCERGCPSCVGPENEIGSDGKQTALKLLEEVMQYERS